MIHPLQWYILYLQISIIFPLIVYQWYHTSNRRHEDASNLWLHQHMWDVNPTQNTTFPANANKATYIMLKLLLTDATAYTLPTTKPDSWKQEAKSPNTSLYTNARSLNCRCMMQLHILAITKAFSGKCSSYLIPTSKSTFKVAWLPSTIMYSCYHTYLQVRCTEYGYNMWFSNFSVFIVHVS